eukprot:SAG22_NODE_20778_length_263_cov_0.365854_1_plen_36_part_01
MDNIERPLERSQPLAAGERCEQRRRSRAHVGRAGLF